MPVSQFVKEGVPINLPAVFGIRERLMRAQTLRARPRWRRRPPGLGERPDAAVTPNVLDRAFGALAPNRKWIADFTYISPMDFGRGRCGKAQDYFSFSGPDGQPIESSQPALDAPNPLCFAGG